MMKAVFSKTVLIRRWTVCWIAPHYTRPEVWEGQAVPAALLSGHHAQYRTLAARPASCSITAQHRPELVDAARA